MKRTFASLAVAALAASGLFLGSSGAAVAATCTAPGPGPQTTDYSLQPEPPVEALLCDTGNINGNPGKDAIVDGYAVFLLDKSDENKGLVQGSLTIDESAGTWEIDTTALSGYDLDSLILGLKAGPNFAAFALNGVTSGTFTINPTSLSHANLYGVPVPGAVWLLGSALVGLVGVARRKQAA